MGEGIIIINSGDNIGNVVVANNDVVIVEKVDISPIVVKVPVLVAEKFEPVPQGLSGIKGDKGDIGDKGDKGDKGDPLMVWESINW
jgi:hypothetical protein